MNTNNGVQLSIRDILYAMRKRLRTIILLTIVGLIVGFVLSGMTYLQGAMTRNFSINASVVITTKGKNGKFASGDQPERADFLMSQELADTVRYIIKNGKIINDVIDGLGLIGITEDDISSNLQIRQYNETPILEFSLTWRTSEEGIKILRMILDKANTLLQEKLSTGSVEVVTEPYSRYIVGGNLNVPLWGLMAILGFVLGAGMAALDVLIHPTLIDLRDVSEFGLETIGVIGKEPGSLFNEGSPETRQRYSAAAYIVNNRMGKTTPKRIYVTSARRGEGRTSVSANLARAISEMGKKVLLIDFDMRNPELGLKFLDHIDFYHSLNALYRGDIDEKEAVTSIDGYLDILPVVLEHNPIPIDRSILDMISKMSERYEYVIMDTPPVGQISDTLILNEITDAAIMVIGYDMSQKNDISESIERLDKSGVRILGAIVNQEQELETINLFKTTKTKKQTQVPYEKINKQKLKNEIKKELKTKEKAAKEKQKEKQKENKKKEEETKPDEIIIKKEKRQHNILEESMPGLKKTITDEEATQALLQLGLSEDEKTKP